MIHRIITCLLIVSLLSAPTFADDESENFVEKNASIVLEVLSHPELSPEEKAEQFNNYMEEFAFIDRVSRFVIGKYGRKFKEPEYKRYEKAFKNFMLAVYITELLEFGGAELIVHGSKDRKKGDSVVKTTLRKSNGETLKVDWRVLVRDGKHGVVDVAVTYEGSTIWLAIEQRAQFLSILDRNQGSADALVSLIECRTNKLLNPEAPECDF